MFGGDQSTELIRHHWDRRAGKFDEEADHGLVSDEQREAWHSLLSRLVGGSPRRVLDVGCGTGFLALRLAELGHIVTGVDLSGKMIEQARDKAEQAALKIEFEVGDAVELDCADETYDFVVARHVIWNLPDPARGVAEWLRVLRPGGRLLLFECKWADSEAMARSHRRPTMRLFTRVLGWAAVIIRSSWYRTKLLSWRYRRLALRLPFAGGPAQSQLVSFLEANSVYDVSAEPLMDPTLWGMDPTLWGESQQYPRYVVAGTRSARRKDE
ncbi:MAG: class I SAM-dependent methyltransferase [Solirubrobacterales bacterium]|nr:class I SAM-dependent methyltransferase [Solirubrobacterales bacterium]